MPKSNFGLTAQLGAALFAVIALGGGSTAVLSVALQGAQARMMDVAQRLDQETAQAQDLVDAIEAARLDVVQVQQFLSDVSATRGQDGLDDGFSKAHDFAESFHQDLDRATRAAKHLNSPSLTRGLEEVGASFPAYYRVGSDMARAYVARGPGAGNQLMPAFDAEAIRLTAALDQTTASARATLSAAHHHSLKERNRTAQVERYLQRAMWAVTLILMVSGAAIFRMVWRNILAPLSLLTRAMLALAQGRIANEVNFGKVRGEIGDLCAAFNVFRASMAAQEQSQQQQEAAREVAQQQRREAEARARQEAEGIVVGTFGLALGALAQGDLAYRIEARLPEAYEPLRSDYNNAAAALCSNFLRIGQISENIEIGAKEIGDAASDLAHRTQLQAADVERAASSVGRLKAKALIVAANSLTATQIASSVSDEARTNSTISDEAIEAMRAISGSAAEIREIASVIDEIAYQTNLLALNAGVEAARAGDSGRGFAVVAAEIRALSHRTTKAAREIGELILLSNSNVETGLNLVKRSGATLNEVVQHFGETAASIAAISEAIGAQAQELDDINSTLGRADKFSQANAATAEQNTSTAEAFSQDTALLYNLIRAFKLPQTTPGDLQRAAAA